MSFSNKIVLTTPQILEAYEAHGNDFIVVNFESCRKYKNFSQYIDIDIKLADGKISPVRYWKLSTDGIIVASRIRKPEQRKYEAIRIGVQLNYNDEENDNTKALHLLCTAFEAKMRQLKNDSIVTDDERAPRKQADGTYRPFHLISTKIVTPLQSSAKNKDGDIVDLENPFFWLSMPKKKFFGNGEVEKPSVHFEDKYYADERGQPDMDRPIMTHEYAPRFFNIDDFYHHPRTGVKIFKRLGAVDNTSGNNYLDNTNIQDYLTKGSALMGNLKFELAVSGRQCKLDVALHGTYYVKVADQVDGGGSAEVNEAVDAFSSRYASISNSNKQTDNSFPDDMDEDFDYEE